MILISTVSMQSVVGLGFCMLPGVKKFGLLLFFWSVALLNGKVCECEVTINAFEYGNGF